MAAERHELSLREESAAEPRQPAAEPRQPTAESAAAAPAATESAPPASDTPPPRLKDPPARLSVRFPIGAVATVALALSACGGQSHPQASSGSAGGLAGTERGANPRTARLPADYQPLPIGRGPAFAIPPTGRAVQARVPVAGLRCRSRPRPGFGVHLELYARRLVIPVAAGIGIAPPLRRSGAYVLGGACTYAIRTYEPTGVAVVDTGSRLTLGDLFAVWGQPLSVSRLASFSGPVTAFVGGRRWRGAAASIPLSRHAEIVLELGGFVPPHPAYLFPPGS